ncbi:MAG: FdtA/QdtA family cupin domain-containing protein [Clostridia bacterium]|nr:FdtA/QdtA family cupin domain-containing protein [Clostridia bacterium]
MDIKPIDFQQHGDSRGMLVVAEYQKEIPFTVKRIYYIYGAEAQTRRGYHSHKNLQQIYIAIHGSCKVTLTDGTDTQTVCLDTPTKGLYIGHNVWREIFDFSSDAVLLVLASDTYSEDDYIRTYQEFQEWLSKQN